jgi:starch synthase (maltosyl-transferring)
MLPSKETSFALQGEDGRKRVAIEGVHPEIERGRFPIKRTAGEPVVVEANLVVDGHDLIGAALIHRQEGVSEWTEIPMRSLGNDRWQGRFVVSDLGVHWYTIRAWIDRFGTWQRDFRKRVQAGQDVSVEILIGAALVEEAVHRAAGEAGRRLGEAAQRLRDKGPLRERVEMALSPELGSWMGEYPDRRWATRYEKDLGVVVDRERARFGAWYEMFPRSCAEEEGRHGTFQDCQKRLSYVAGMGFDVLYLPPIHPIGRTHRKGRNNTPSAGPGDCGSPWAIGSEEGGHKAVHPRLGNLEDFRNLVSAAAGHGLEIALDLAFQCSPDHPYVKEHPEWFRWRPDNRVQHAENPPKKYEDIYPLHFETEQWRELWEELLGVVRFWIDQGVRIFRVDNPHTKPFAFWEWLISAVKREHPEVIFLSEAFTRPAVMVHLAHRGFSQSYTYFAWRNAKWEIEQYFKELVGTDVREFFRPNLWPNTPDILTEYLQTGGRSGFLVRLVLAATLGASYGIYGPPFELCESASKEPGSEEYLDSEKYEIRHWDIRRPDSLRELIARVNRIRRENPALQSDRSLRFHPVDNDQIVCYSKHTEDFSNFVLVVVNLDPHHAHSGWLDLPLSELGMDPRQAYQVHDLLSDARYLWHGSRNYVEIDPRVVPAHVFRLRRRVRTERDFDYFL